ncbi:hypothetical protein GCM10009552_23870 [Rothia nasimurium]|uniref:Peptidase S74 domain-containing protein n=1 Tax=Luteibacter anthropi TaxID=564369 RepID=A0A7X5U9Q8_9GAMM|nr:hypothetical protein [Luteibacter anthropi]NII06449.1 hypothetical protein [Luteibacter anthropi]
MAMNIQRINFDPIGGDSVTAAFRKLDLDVGEVVNAIDGDGSTTSGISNRLALAENKLGALGNVSTRNIGTSAGTVAAGDDARFLTVGTTPGTVAAGDDARITSALPKVNPTFSGGSGIGRTGVKFEYAFRVSNGNSDNGIGGAYGEWAGDLTPAVQIDCQAPSSHYMGIRWTHWGVKHLAAIHAYEGGAGSPTTLIGFHIAGKTNSHIFDSNGNAFFAGTLSQNSDYRIKANASSLSAPEVAAGLRVLNPLTYNDTRRPATDRPLVGLFAHELQAQFPLLVDGEKDAVQTEMVWVGDTTPYLPGMEPSDYTPPHQESRQMPLLQNVNYVGLVPYLIAGWQHSDQRLGALEAEIGALRTQVEALLAR